MRLTFISLISAVIIGTPALAQSRFLLNDRTGDRVWLLDDASGNGMIGKDTELFIFFDASNTAGTPGPTNPTALGVSPNGIAIMADQGNGNIYRLIDLNNDWDALDEGESVVFANGTNASGINLAFPTGMAFDSTGAMYITNAGNAFGPDGIFRLLDLNNDNDAQDADEITPYVLAPFPDGGPNGPFSPQEIVFDSSDVGYMLNAGSEGLGLRGVYRFEDLNGNGRADDRGEFTVFFDATNADDFPVQVGFGIDIDRAADAFSIYIHQLEALNDQVVRLTDLNGDGDAQDSGEQQLVWENPRAGITSVDVLSLVNGDVFVTDNGGDGGRTVIRLSDNNGDGDFLDEGEESLFLANVAGGVEAVRQIAAYPRPGDINIDDVVSGADLLLLLNSWGDCPVVGASCPADLNHDNDVNGSDLLILLNGWG